MLLELERTAAAFSAVISFAYYRAAASDPNSTVSLSTDGLCSESLGRLLVLLWNETEKACCLSCCLQSLQDQHRIVGVELGLPWSPSLTRVSTTATREACHPDCFSSLNWDIGSQWMSMASGRLPAYSNCNFIF